MLTQTHVFTHLLFLTLDFLHSFISQRNQRCKLRCVYQHTFGILNTCLESKCCSDFNTYNLFLNEQKKAAKTLRVKPGSTMPIERIQKIGIFFCQTLVCPHEALTFLHVCIVKTVRHVQTHNTQIKHSSFLRSSCMGWHMHTWKHTSY